MCSAPQEYSRFPRPSHYDMARLGIGLYGASTLPTDTEEPLAVANLHAAHHDHSYPPMGQGGDNRIWPTGELTRKSRGSHDPIGYADGMNRHFGRGAVSVTVNGKEAPTIGNICMDSCMIDVTGIDCKVGTRWRYSDATHRCSASPTCSTHHPIRSADLSIAPRKASLLPRISLSLRKRELLLKLLQIFHHVVVGDPQTLLAKFQQLERASRI